MVCGGWFVMMSLILWVLRLCVNSWGCYCKYSCILIGIGWVIFFNFFLFIYSKLFNICVLYENMINRNSWFYLKRFNC